ncbi:type IV toxin-antitoxin system AbiEi family antitoxin domain-containing protein [Nocardioides sp. Kera G14]|uniref:type IV toxin-antitoxin system AbiEi family antitoxin domain-containing protein n=1 Tax=Nocardioides sp. Kera G14 TaxID=2884264 RepID=UPI001D128AEB|nr:type IV toxin-antitoxin system AbiEi family antitoxin domain-containing protein [Nocardioides sp. Kera G14]UDY22176.1 type IV toxin-antitoxin system AbiEi family antitoxin domain-containing protein [Nocardioides sp. Kera G14]
MTTITLGPEPFTVAELTTLGLSPKRLRALHEAGSVRRVLRGVYVDATLDDTLELRARALARVVDENHVVVDRSAAWLHGIDTFAYGEGATPPLEICTLPARHATQRSGTKGGRRDLADRDIMRLGNVRVTTPLRTALDLGCHLRRREAYAALCAFAREQGVQPSHLVREVARFRGRRGVIQLRGLLGHVTGAVESHREAWTLLAILDAGVMAPILQFWIEIDGVPTYRLDLAYPRQRVAVEYDGEADHSTPEQRVHDAERRAWLTAHGWTVIVVRKGDFTGRELDRWLGELRTALRPTYTSRRW